MGIISDGKLHIALFLAADGQVRFSLIASSPLQWLF